MEYSRLAVLHRYFIWANKMRILFDGALMAEQRGKDPVTWFADDAGIFMSYWYGGLYVVIEGYRSLRCQDAKIDSMLVSPHVDLLKRYRNGCFHYQDAYFDDRFVDFISDAGSAVWVRELHQVLGDFFLAAAKGLRAVPNTTQQPTGAPSGAGG